MIAAVAWAFVALLAVAVHLPNLPFGKTPQEDAGVFLYIGQTILDGGLPYRDVWDHKPPSLYYLDALGLALGGGSIFGVWALQAFCHVVAALASFAILRRAFGTGPALVGTSAWLLALPRLFLFEGHFSNFVQVLLAPLQFGALAIFVSLQRTRGPASLSTIALGATAGLAALVTPAGTGLWFAMGITKVISLIRQRSLTAVVRFSALAAAGAALVITLVAAVLAAAGILEGAIDQAVLFNGNYARASSIEARIDSLRDGLRLLGSSGAAFLALGGIIVGLFWRRAFPPGSQGRLLLDVALISVPIELALGSSSGRLHQYYWLAALPAVGILGAAVAVALQQSLSPRLAGVTRLPATRIATVLLAILIVGLAARPTLLAVRVAQSREDGVTRAAVEYVRENSSPGDEIFVWGSRASVHVLSDRRAPTRFIYQYAPLYTRGYHLGPANLEELLRDLDRRQPLLILDASKDSAVTPPLDEDAIRSYDSHDPLFVIPDEAARIAELVSAKYVRVGTIPGNEWPVWRLRGR